MAHRQFTIFAPAAYRPEADALAARIRAANPSQVPLVRTVGSFPQLQTELHKVGADSPKKPLVTCETDGSAKYILGPAVVLGTEVKSASANLAQNNGVATGGWQVDLSFNGSGRQLGDFLHRA